MNTTLVKLVALVCFGLVAVACEPRVFVDQPAPSSNHDGDIVVRRAAPRDWVADWTLLIYAANDDLDPNLVAAFDEDADEWQHGLGGSALFRILVQRDYAPFQFDADNLPRPSERYAIYREERHHPEYPPGSGAPEALLLGETDTTSSTTLRDFLVYGIRKFPARHYWVAFTGHGDGFAGLAHDASAAPGKRLHLAGLASALTEASQVIASEIRTQPQYAGPNTSNRIDVISFDACRLGTIEVATSLGGAADFMIASQESMPHAGHPYQALRYIAQDEPDADPHALVEAVVTDYVRAYVEGVSTAGRQYVGTSVTSIGLDLRHIAALEQSLADLAAVVEKNRPGGFSCADVEAFLVNACDESQVALPRDTSASAQRTNPTPAAAASVDLLALLKHLAHGPTCSSSSQKNLLPEDDISRAATRTLAILGFPKRAAPLDYGGQYQEITEFNPSSPFVVEAQRVDPAQGVHLGGLSVLWGNPYDLLYRQNGRTLFDTYRALPFEAATGWTRMFAACIEEAEACRAYEPSPDEPISSNPCANF